MSSRLLAWLCGYSPSLALLGLRPTWRWFRTGELRDAAPDQKALQKLIDDYNASPYRTPIVDEMRRGDYYSPDADSFVEVIHDAARALGERCYCPKCYAERVPSLRLAPCDLPPSGWYCTREKGHDGPCAARRSPPEPLPVPPDPIRGHH